MFSRDLTQTAFLPCEGRCSPRATRHHFHRLNRNAEAHMLDVMFRCSQCERERVWGVLEPGVLVPTHN
jgi:hypothetical protein